MIDWQWPEFKLLPRDSFAQNNDRIDLLIAMLPIDGKENKISHYSRRNIDINDGKVGIGAAPAKKFTPYQR